MIYYGFLLFLVFEYLRPGAYLPALYAVRLNALIPIGVFLGAALVTERTTNQHVWREPNTRMILFLLGLIVLSAAHADVTLYVFNVFKTVLGYVLIYCVIVKHLSELRQIRGVFKTLILIHIAVVALSPRLITNPESLNYITSGAFLGDGNDFALSVNLVIPFCLFLLFDAKTVRQKLVYGAALVFLVLSIVATASRGGTVALACVGLYYWLKSDKKFLTAVIAAAVIALILLYAPSRYFERMATIRHYEESGSAQGRILVWKASVQMALDHPLFGVGAGHFGVKYGVEYRPAGYGRTEVPWSTAHSIYFLVLGELGLPGLAVLLLLIGSNLTANRRLQRQIRKAGDERQIRYARLLTCLSASMVAFAVGGAFLSVAYYPHMYILAGLLAAARRQILEQREASESRTPALSIASVACRMAMR